MSKRRGQRKRDMRRDPRGNRPQEPRSGLLDRMREPRAIARLEFLRLVLPLAILGFMSSRMIYADHWLGTSGFELPDLGGDYRQPLYLPRLPNALAYLLVIVMGVSGIALSLGIRSRISAAIFSATLFFVLYSDRLSAFTVSKLAPVLILALALTPAGERYGLSAMKRARKGGALPDQVSYGNVFFFQALLVFMYSASGVCKARGDWLSIPHLLHTHLHGSYQTSVSWLAANSLPAFSWNLFQGTTLFFELFAPLLFFFTKLRPYALLYGLGMHALIGLMFGPVIWFALLMSVLLIACFAKERWLETLLGRLFPIGESRS